MRFKHEIKIKDYEEIVNDFSNSEEVRDNAGENFSLRYDLIRTTERGLFEKPRYKSLGFFASCWQYSKDIAVYMKETLPSTTTFTTFIIQLEQLDLRLEPVKFRKEVELLIEKLDFRWTDSVCLSEIIEDMLDLLPHELAGM